MEEIWRDIKGFERYYRVSSTGRVMGLKRTVDKVNGRRQTMNEKILLNHLSNIGYMTVNLHKDGKLFTSYVHRLVLETFLPNLLNKQTVNHKNGIKTDNRLENLEWATYGENNKHAYSIGLKKGKICSYGSVGKPIYKLSVNGELISEFSSISEAARNTLISIGAISRCATGISKTAGGFIWRFKKEKYNQTLYLDNHDSLYKL